MQALFDSQEVAWPAGLQARVRFIRGGDRVEELDRVLAGLDGMRIGPSLVSFNQKVKEDRIYTDEL